MNRIPGINTRLAATVDYNPRTGESFINVIFDRDDIREFAGEIPGIDTATLAAALRAATVTVTTH